ncbi:MAG: Lrp/AsnC family transcriptional regulator [Nanoarchaeota archaeon]|nr:Lrp/AsnC family transcriptional regulator [Nanoarchaeota archaeon]
MANNKHKLTTGEKRILGKLELDSRTPFSKIAKKIRKSQQNVSYSVSSLIERGMINGFYTIIDYSKLDVLSFRVYFKVTYVGEERFHELIEDLKSNPHTSWVATCGGRYDLVCTFFAYTPSHFNKVLRELMEKFPHQLRDHTVLTTVVIRKFGRKYLYDGPKEFKEMVVGGDKKPVNVEQMDLKIISKLSENARASSVKIADVLSLTPKTIIKRMKKLYERKIIKGFKPFLDVRKIGYTPNILLISYHNVPSKIEDEFISYLRAYPNVVNIVKTLGEWGIEIEIETKDSSEFRKIQMEIRERFALLIKEIESIPIYKTYRRNFFPDFIISPVSYN